MEILPTQDQFEELRALVAQMPLASLTQWRSQVDAELYAAPSIDKMFLRDRLDEALEARAGQ